MKTTSNQIGGALHLAERARALTFEDVVLAQRVRNDVMRWAFKRAEAGDALREAVGVYAANAIADVLTVQLDIAKATDAVVARLTKLVPSRANSLGELCRYSDAANLDRLCIERYVRMQALGAALAVLAEAEGGAS